MPRAYIAKFGSRFAIYLTRIHVFLLLIYLFVTFAIIVTISLDQYKVNVSFVVIKAVESGVFSAYSSTLS